MSEYVIEMEVPMKVELTLEADTPEQARDIAREWSPRDGVAVVRSYYASDSGNGEHVTLPAPIDVLWEMLDIADPGVTVTRVVEAVEETENETGTDDGNLVILRGPFVGRVARELTAEEEQFIKDVSGRELNLARTHEALGKVFAHNERKESHQ